MDVCLIGMGGNENLEAGKHLLCKLQRNLMSSFGCQLLIGMEGLREVIEHSALGLSILQLGIHKFTVSGFGKTVDTRHKFFAFVNGFAVALTVKEDECKSGS
mgnify:FL=1